MPYVLGIDLGAGQTAAAVSRLVGDGYATDGWSAAEAVPLGPGTGSVPSVLRVLPDGSVRADGGRPAGSPHPAGDGTWAGSPHPAGDGTWAGSPHPAGGPDPGRLGTAVRGFGRRVGDDVPLILSGEPHTGQSLLTALARWVVDRVEAREGGPADRVVVCHPGEWGAHRIGLLHQALWRAGLPVTLVPAPVAVAHGYAAQTPIGAGATVAVQDLGAAEVSVVRCAEVGTFELLGCAQSGVDLDADGLPGGLEPLLDDALFDHVAGRLRLRVEDLDRADPLVLEGIRRLREECAVARERLYLDVEAGVAVELPGSSTRVAVTRAEFEDLARPSLTAAVDALLRTVRGSGLAPDGLEAVVLAGGLARMPLVGRLVAAALPVRQAGGGEPELRTALGAALAARRFWDRPEDLPAALTGGAIEHAGRDDDPGGYGAERSLAPLDAGGEAWAGSARGEAWAGSTHPAGGEAWAGSPHGEAWAGSDGGDLDGGDLGGGDLDAPPPRPPVRISPLDLPRRGGGRRALRQPGAGFFALLAAVGVVTIGIAVFLAVAL